jgi:hypothetical protein
VITEYYNIKYHESTLFSNLTEEEYFDKMMDLSNQYYETGEPKPEQLRTEIFIGELNNGN